MAQPPAPQPPSPSPNVCILGGHAAAGDRGPQRIGNLLGARAGAQIRSLGRPLVINIRVILIWEVLGGHCEVLWRSLARTLEVFQVSLGSVFQHVRPTGWLPTTFDPCTGIGNQTPAVYQQPPNRGRIHIIFASVDGTVCVSVCVCV